ncbi:nucleoside hydrolase [Anaerolineae bacterium CFX9]|nr:nucleoside hydrolase [Anaerolineae bacterium CFX9]
MPRKIIIDTDPGIDDAMAIYFALRSPELEVVGLTTIFGNVHTSLATTNALRLLEIAGRTDIPVAKGVDDPLAHPYRGPVPYVHGEDGQGNVFLPPPTTKAIDKSAAQFIIDTVMSNPGEITLVPVGPLSNIALALRMEPRIAQNVKEVVLMGGNALGPGNASPAAEANILNDAEAADVVFGAPWQVTMVGLDVTHEVKATKAHLDEYKKINNPMAQHIVRILPVYIDFFESTYNTDGIFVHDSSAIAYLIDPTLFTVVQSAVRVDTDSGISRGKTWPNLGERPRAPWEGRPKVNICVAVEGERLLDLELERMRGD